MNLRLYAGVHTVCIHSDSKTRGPAVVLTQSHRVPSRHSRTTLLSEAVVASASQPQGKAVRTIKAP